MVEMFSWRLLADRLAPHRRVVSDDGRDRSETRGQSVLITRALLSEWRRGFDVAFGRRAAIVDRQVVQDLLGPGRYSTARLEKLAQKRGLGPEAQVVRWSIRACDLTFSVDDLLSVDGHLFTATATVRIKLRRRPADTVIADAELDINIEDTARLALGRALGERLATHDAASIYPGQWRGPQHADDVTRELTGAVAPEWVESLSVESVALSNAHFDEMQRVQITASQEQQRIAHLLERSRLETALWREQLVENPASPLSAHERQQVQRHAALVTSGTTAADLEPFGLARGTHTLRIGDGWSGFDGRFLWRVRLTRIKAGPTWPFIHRSPVKQLAFEISRRPGDRKAVHELHAKHATALRAGDWEIPVRVIGGDAAEVTVEVGAAVKRA